MQVRLSKKAAELVTKHAPINNRSKPKEASHAVEKFYELDKGKTK